MELRNKLKWLFRPPLVIMVSGKARHGKDTFGEELMKNLESLNIETQRLSFGDQIKKIAERDDRDYLQALGSAGRMFVDKDIWIKRAVSDYNGADVVVITDTRYPNEISFFENKPHMSVRINRIDENGMLWESKLSEEQKNHPTEMALDSYSFDYEFDARDVMKLKAIATFMADRCIDKLNSRGGIF